MWVQMLEQMLAKPKVRAESNWEQQMAGRLGRQKESK
jgi:hypothetical protein